MKCALIKIRALISLYTSLLDRKLIVKTIINEFNTNFLYAKTIDYMTV